MKILHVLYAGLGGHGNVFFSMIDADINKEFNYQALFFGWENVQDEYIKKADDRNIQWDFIKKKKGIDLTAYRSIKKIIIASECDIIFLHSSSYIFPAFWGKISSKRKKKIVIRETQANHLKTKAEWAGFNSSLILSDKIIFLSDEYEAELKKNIPFFINKNKFAVIPNGIDMNIFKPEPKKSSAGTNIGMQSRLSPNKDHSTLIKAAKIIIDNKKHEVTFYIAGDGDRKTALQQLCIDLNIDKQVIFTGLLNEQALASFINMLDIYVHATLGETMSTAIMQVMACKKPVIASNVKGVNNMVKDKENGLLVAAKNETELAHAIEYLIENNNISNLLAENAYQTALEKFSNERMFSQYKKLFYELKNNNTNLI